MHTDILLAYIGPEMPLPIVSFVVAALGTVLVFAGQVFAVCKKILKVFVRREP